MRKEGTVTRRIVEVHESRKASLKKTALSHSEVPLSNPWNLKVKATKVAESASGEVEDKKDPLRFKH